MLAQTWDLSAFFADFDDPSRSAFEAELGSAANQLATEQNKLGTLAADGDGWAAWLQSYEALLGRLSHLASYVTCLASADAKDERFALAEGRVGLLRSEVDKLAPRLRRALGEASDPDFEAFIGRASLSGAQFTLQQLRREAKTSMTPEQEALASDLGNFGIIGWGRLYDSLASQLMFRMEQTDGSVRELPMAQRRSLMADAKRDVRRRAFVGGNRAWHSVREVAAAALNHIAGTRHLLHERRGVGHFLDVARHQAALSARTLDSMNEAVLSQRGLAQRGLKLKARAMGLNKIDWFDLEAPLPFGDGNRVSYEQAVDLVFGAFSLGYPRLAGYFRKMVDSRHIEVEVREGKRPGAYCIGSDHTEDVRIFMTFAGSLGDVSTLAHEVGHAWQAELMRPCRVLSRQLPMTLAETASTFAESLLADGMLSQPGLSPSQRALLLGEQVGDGAAFLLDVPTRFLFERRFYEERKIGEVPASRLSELMSEAQREVFGDALGETDPLFWASKLHFFIPDLMFYNFPYTFGFLLSRGMYAIFKERGADFLPDYEAFLQGSGLGFAHEVAQRTVGVDLEDPAFWVSAVQTLKAPTDELEALLSQLDS